MHENSQGGKDCGKLQIVLRLCVQPVEQSLPVAPVHVKKHAARVTRATPRQPFADTIGQLINQESASEFGGELDEEIEHS